MRVPASLLLLGFAALAPACASGGDDAAAGPGDDGGVALDDGGGDATANGDAHAGDAKSDAPASSTTTTQACTDHSAAYCTQLQTCAPFLVTQEYGDVATCEKRRGITCLDEVAAPGSGWTGDALEACGKAIAGQTCGDFLDGKPAPKACQVTGLVTTSEACRYGSQCGTSYCRYAAGASCGNCVTLGATGAPCTQSADCDGNLACATAGTCQPPSPLGGACSGTAPCAPGLSCIGSSCVTPGGLGAMCKTANSGADCDFTQGVYCSATTTSCAAYAVVTDGGSCAGTTTGVCAGGGTCFQSSCVAAAADGTPCNAQTGTNCLTPSTCNGGTCGLYVAAQCK